MVVNEAKFMQWAENWTEIKELLLSENKEKQSLKTSIQATSKVNEKQLQWNEQRRHAGFQNTKNTMVKALISRPH